MAAAEPDQMVVLLEGVVDVLGVIVGVDRLHLPADARALPARRTGRGPGIDNAVREDIGRRLCSRRRR